MPSVKSAESEILLGIIRSDRNFRSSMTNGNSLRSCLLLLCTIQGLFYPRTHALPFEYLDEHDDFNYDLDTAQSQAKYDARLLSQQMLSEAELQRQRAEAGHDDGLDTGSTRAQGIPAASGTDPAGSAEEEELEPHSRAAACFTNGHKYTHGQKVPRLDACEVCLCMDGEIFCWWEKCDKANVNRAKAVAASVAAPETVEMSESHSNRNSNRDGDSEDDGYGYGYGDDDDGEGDYSDPYRQDSTTGKSTKVHKTARKVGKRHKHRKNQKNFNDYEVYHSHRQKLKQEQQKQNMPDYKKSGIKQQLPHQQKQKQKHQSDDGGNYNIIKQHKHEQQQQQQQQQQKPKLAEKQQPNAEALAVNQAAKATHYQQPVVATPPHSEQQQHHPHQQPHSASKILNFPENLPAVLYYDYKTEEHEHHQHQHHQQHLLHEKQRLQHQLQQQQQEQKEALSRQKAAESGAAGAGNQADAGVELTADVTADKNFDEAETDSDILPEPPTKRPKAGPTQWPASSSSTTTTTKALMTTQSGVPFQLAAAPATSSVTPATTTTTTTRTNEMVTSTLSGLEKAMATVAVPNTGQLQHDRSGHDPEESDDAFHRWLTSTELNGDNTNPLDDNLEQETPASTIIDDVGITNKSDRSNSNSNSSNASKDNGNGNGIADAVFFRSSYNDYSSEFNGSVVNIDITLTAVDVHPRRQTDLIANGNRTSGESAGNSDRAAGVTTMDPQAASSSSSISSSSIARSGSNQDNTQQSSIVLPYTMTTIITTTPMAPGRMCNVLGKLYKIGDILPQDTGNCLQCICTDAVTPDEMPSVTCSPHNCPPLVLPDLFDATGY
ncbi:probable serine/threonine-protein kinase MARK-A [Drosophila bipectinata]|uniref:probable serine/threonine-protein kinase MARK-A n=1 Tax=Drosophila bipectinata TaxID=42026 RepID=UPI001C8A8F17|nr:probable WRKY transcription factor protein 1 [Drosophila bipectinata]XP_017093872.2 probable WRKY transcription factor protein 1 [Drosophila bipectinata]XP_017093873.2 probable WRKY transcription factor protein 1 [Drosophila bipectinata]XP_017093874.2 probable WRKY transcription factor protein 1 [Drosophila bipectinata]XP_017093876.2 probable WRKY transcription factor protein 1 [Drosophila bipectinata]XP_017093877.2 probable WRKY transcription factor protein 1 [Drosophila bipectinata]XP_04